MTNIQQQLEARGFEYGVKHLLIEKEGLLSENLAELLSIDKAQIAHLLRFGCVYVQNQRTTQDTHLAANTYVRVHTKPRRFIANDHKWNERIIYQDSDFVVVNKISGLPVNSSVDNLHENLQSYLETTLGQKLFGTHRLDVPTRGLIVFAKTLEFQSLFNRLLTERAVTKKYRAQVEGIFKAQGLITHFMEPSPRAPKKVLTEPREKWLKCELIIEKSEVLENGNSLVQIELLTGRTHQIRAQLSALGFPIVGDKAYGAFSEGGVAIELESWQLEFENPMTQKLHQFKL